MTIVFDYDGTLHDTKRLYGCAFRKAYDMLVSEGYAPERFYSDRDVSKYLGVSAPDMWKSFMPELPQDIVHRASMTIGNEMTDGILNGRAKLYDGIPEMLDVLKSKGHRLMILSNCRHAYMEAHRSALGLDRWFSDYFCGEDYGFIPKEEIFRVLTERHPDNRFIMVGDRYSDIKAGTANGVFTIGCAYGFGSPDELADSDVVVNSPMEILSCVE